MRTVAATTMAVLLTIGIGVGAIVGAGHASLSSPAGRGQAAPAAGAPGRSGEGGARSSPACASTGSTQAAVVVRSAESSIDQIRFSFPATLRIDNADRARQALSVLCSLPPMPKGVFHCPEDLAIAYLFRFSLRSGGEVVARLDPTGCETVSGLGPLRWMAREPPAFWRALGSALGLPDATRSTFAGAMPS
jgi:hypothetical protein